MHEAPKLGGFSVKSIVRWLYGFALHPSFSCAAISMSMKSTTVIQLSTDIYENTEMTSRLVTIFAFFSCSLFVALTV
ncbi:hypothetical protein Y032_0136g1968 [Ancylostoma ceylanicum]|uniref:Uncharacterized protein n=1 Tax=Ancylostoma ceylanicum TaxID=53326 RepID=A0A016T576_9BILA|nr:hypothetical protein Y032_0136g1968 [Ancylostoma ceylanicum]